MKGEIEDRREETATTDLVGRGEIEERGDRGSEGDDGGLVREERELK